MNRKYLKLHCEILETIITSYSEDTAIEAINLLNTEENLLKMVEILEANPTEQEFLKKIEEIR